MKKIDSSIYTLIIFSVFFTIAFLWFCNITDDVSEVSVQNSTTVNFDQVSESVDIAELLFSNDELIILEWGTG